MPSTMQDERFATLPQLREKEKEKNASRILSPWNSLGRLLRNLKHQTLLLKIPRNCQEGGAHHLNKS